MIRLGASGPVKTATDAEWEAGRQHFRDKHHIRFPGFIAPDVLRKIQAHLREGLFVPKQHGDIANELCCWDTPAADILAFLSNDPRLFDLVMDVTGIPGVVSFLGRIYRMTPHEHHDSWHSDAGEDRLMAMSVNLSEEVYRGGALLLGERNRPETDQRIDNSGPGDALIFRIDKSLLHYVTDVEPGPTKTAWAGWFQSAPHFMDVLRGKSKL